MLNLTREGPVFTLTLNDGENRWNTTFVRAVAKAIDEVEASTGAAALVTTSSNEKFFSNGLDLAWIQSTGEHRGGDRTVFADEFMKLMGRLITLPIPTICAINGHAFGAGFMFALCHDVRVMREDRGFACANEMQLGMAIPRPELMLFRHKIPMQRIPRNGAARAALDRARCEGRRYRSADGERRESTEDRDATRDRTRAARRQSQGVRRSEGNALRRERGAQRSARRGVHAEALVRISALSLRCRGLPREP